MLHCNNSVVPATRLDSDTTQRGLTTAPGIFTAKTLQEVLGASLFNQQQQEVDTNEGAFDEIISPYGRLPRQIRKIRYKQRSSELVLLQRSLRVKHDIVLRRKKCQKLAPIPLGDSKMLAVATFRGNQLSSGDVKLLAPDEHHLERLRSGLQQTKSKHERDAERLKSDIQWIHGHFPVLKLANSKCSLTLRQQLLRNAFVHVSVNYVRRKAFLFWYQKLLDAQHKERLQLSASRQLITMFEKVSFDRVAGKLNLWRQWVMECQAQESVAAVITLQHFARFIHCSHEKKASAEREMALMQALQELSQNARTIQKVYHRHCQRVKQRQREAAAVKIQHIHMRRSAHSAFVQRQQAAMLIQQTFRAYSVRRCHKRAEAIAQLFDRSRERQARRIQITWRNYTLWRDCELPHEVVKSLIDQVEFLDAVLSIQRHLRGFQCRSQIKKKNESAGRIQHCWRGRKHRVAARAERRMIRLRRDKAASCLQRTFLRSREERKIRSILHESTCPMYLRVRHFRESIRERFRVPIAESAIVVIQITWRLHIAYEKEKQLEVVATTRIQHFLGRITILSKWRSLVVKAPRHHRNGAARLIQRWIRHLRQGNTKSTHRRASAVYVVEQISAAIRIQRWHRRNRCDSWRFLVNRLFAKELPKCIEAVNQIARCWRAHCARRQEQSRRASTITVLIEQQYRAEVENRAARVIQRMFKRMIDRRDGKILLHSYKISLREDMKRRQQRVIVHNFLEEKSQERKKKQETKSRALGARQVSTKSSVDSPQTLILHTDTTESAFSLDESVYSFNTNDSGWQPQSVNSASPQAGNSVQHWSEEYQRAYLYDPDTGLSTWL